MNKKKLTKVLINNILYYKTSFSSKGKYCVGVSCDESNTVSIINTNEKKTIVKFTKDEWSTFIDGVKAGHFDSL